VKVNWDWHNNNMEQVDSSTELHLNRKDLAALADDVVKEEVILESPGHHHHHHHHQVG